MPENEIYIARQPILGPDLDVLAYELLFREQLENRANIVDRDAATTSVLVNSLIDIGIDRIAGDAPVFVNITRGFLVGEYPIPLERRRLVIEVLEDTHVDDELIASLRRLSAQGFRIALDDFLYSPRWDECLEIADIVKLDLTLLDEQAFSDQVALLRRYGVTLLAEKVETREQYEFCKSLGCELFQGYFFAMPSILRGRQAQSSRMAALQLLAAVSNPEADIDTLERAISQDAVLAYKLLRYVNSSAMGLRRQTDSIRQALVFLGRAKIRAMVTLLVMTSVEEKPAALMQTGLIRAAACQNLGEALGFSDVDEFFCVGLLSILDGVFDRPLVEIVDELPVSEDFRRALLDHAGPMGVCLHCAISCERADWDGTETIRLSHQQIARAYLEAISAVENREGLASVIEARPPRVDLDELCARAGDGNRENREIIAEPKFA